MATTTIIQPRHATATAILPTPIAIAIIRWSRICAPRKHEYGFRSTTAEFLTKPIPRWFPTEHGHAATSTDASSSSRAYSNGANETRTSQVGANGFIFQARWCRRVYPKGKNGCNSRIVPRSRWCSRRWQASFQERWKEGQKEDGGCATKDWGRSRRWDNPMEG